MEAAWKERLEESTYRMQLLKAVKQCRDEMLPRAREMADYAAAAFSDSNKSQLTKLERQAITTMAITDIYDYIKLRVGRSGPGEKWRQNDFGHRLLKELEELEATAQAKAKALTSSGSQGREVSAIKRELHLLLAREFIGQMVSNYLFFLAEPGARLHLDAGDGHGHGHSHSNQPHHQPNHSRPRPARR